MFPIAGTAAAALIRINTIRRRDGDAPQKSATITPRDSALAVRFDCVLRARPDHEVRLWGPERHLRQCNDTVAIGGQADIIETTVNRCS